ncbi:MAG TPA: SAM-dependent methyltransferase, partial [Bradyrhizobium sp.]|nr:SAM-dependent methyltransferase [Bradyrhizobium sp.]
MACGAVRGASQQLQPDRIARTGEIGVPTGMVPNPNIAPILFDRALLRARQSRALRLGPATFLLDRVAEDMAERLHAVLREFKSAADIGTAGDQVRTALTGRADEIARIDLPDRNSEPLPLEPESLDLAVSGLAF